MHHFGLTLSRHHYTYSFQKLDRLDHKASLYINIKIRASHRTYYGYSRTTYGLYTGSSTSHPYRIGGSYILRRYGTGEITDVRPYLQYDKIKTKKQQKYIFFLSRTGRLLAVAVPLEEPEFMSVERKALVIFKSRISPWTS